MMGELTPHTSRLLRALGEPAHNPGARLAGTRPSGDAPPVNSL